MKFLVEHWPWFAGGFGLLVLVGVVLSPLAALKLARSLGGFVLDKLRAGIEWLRRPHHWWRIGTMTLALCFTAAAFVAWDARQTIVIVRQQCDVRVAEAQQACTVVKANTRQIVKRVNEETAKVVARAKRDAENDRLAKAAAQAEASRLKREASTFDARMELARKNPDCATLLDIDVGAKCGL